MQTPLILFKIQKIRKKAICKFFLYSSYLREKSFFVKHLSILLTHDSKPTCSGEGGVLLAQAFAGLVGSSQIAFMKVVLFQYIKKVKPLRLLGKLIQQVELKWKEDINS